MLWVNVTSCIYICFFSLLFCLPLSLQPTCYECSNFFNFAFQHLFELLTFLFCKSPKLYSDFESASSTTSKFIRLTPTIVCIAAVDVVRYALGISSSKALWSAKRFLFIRVLFAKSCYNKDPYLIIGSTTALYILSMSVFIPFIFLLLFFLLINCVTFDLRNLPCATKVKPPVYYDFQVFVLRTLCFGHLF